MQQALPIEDNGIEETAHPLAGTRMSGSDIIIQALAQEGTEVVFGYSGGAILPTYDAVFRFNAETNEQGLGPLLVDDEYAVLSLGMQAEYGEQNSLTRVASRRTLDHIVITEDTQSLMPDADLGEQIVIRTDRRMPNFTRDISDHIPVAARFLIGSG